MMSILYILHAVLEYIFVTAFVLRLLLPLARANMRNPISQAVLRATNPLVLPLRRVLPPVGRVDTASVVALVIVQFAVVAALLSLASVTIFGNLKVSWQLFAIHTGLQLVRAILQTYGFAFVVYAIISWIAPHVYSPVGDLLGSLCNPILNRIRRVIPPLAGLDFSVFFACIGIGAIFIALPASPYPFG
jgi:YggT family protein